MDLSRIGIKGIIRIEYINSLTGETEKTEEFQNVVTDYAKGTYILQNGSGEPASVLPSCHIAISTQNTTPVRSNASVSGIIAVASAPSSLPPPSNIAWHEEIASPNGPYGELTEQIPPPSNNTARTFSTVALVTGLSPGEYVTNPQTTNAIAYVATTDPNTGLIGACTQAPYQFLNIFYRLVFLDTTGQGASNIVRYINNYGGAICGVKSCHVTHAYATPFNPPSTAMQAKYQDYYVGNDNFVLYYSFSSGDNSYNSLASFPVYYKYKFQKSFGFNNLVGTIFNTWFRGLSNTLNYNSQAYPLPGDIGMQCAYGIDLSQPTRASSTGSSVYGAPFTNVLRHSSSSNVPFFDSSNSGSSIGVIALLGGSSWANTWPELYQVIITGTQSAPTWYYRVRNWLRFDYTKNSGTGNSYDEAYVNCPYWNPNTPAMPGMHGWRPENNDPQRFSDTQVVLYDLTGVTLLDVFNGTQQSWDATTTPALGCTQIKQVAVDVLNGVIYVGDRSSGLWSINPSANTCSNLVSGGCFGVGVGQSAIAWAICADGLHCSLSWGTLLSGAALGSTFTIANTAWLHCDPDANSNTKPYPSGTVSTYGIDSAHMVQQIGIGVASSGFAATGAGTAMVMYWLGVNMGVLPVTPTAGGISGFRYAIAQGLTNSSGYLRPWPACFDVSGVGSTWAGFNFLGKFGDTSSTFTANNGQEASSQGLTSSIWGYDSYFKISFWNDFYITFAGLISGLFNANPNTNYAYYNSSTLKGSSLILHLRGGIICLSDAIVHIGNNIYDWVYYSWNGNSWIAQPQSPTSPFSPLPTPKTIQVSTPESLPSGISIQFNNGTGAGTNFIPGEYFSFPVAHGAPKDNTWVYSYGVAWYSKPAQFTNPGGSAYSATIPSGAPPSLTFPAASQPGFETMDLDSPLQQWNPTINGVACPTIYVSGESPGVGEISVTALGVITFNAGDAGKTFSCLKYTYIVNS